nr:hypothetical protein [Leptospira weilii]
MDLLVEHGADIHAKNTKGFTPVFKIPWAERKD